METLHGNAEAIKLFRNRIELLETCLDIGTPAYLETGKETLASIKSMAVENENKSTQDDYEDIHPK